MEFSYQTVLSIPPRNYQEELSKQKLTDFNIVQYELIIFIMESKHVAMVFITTCDLVLAYESRLKAYSLSPTPNTNCIYFSSFICSNKCVSST